MPPTHYGELPFTLEMSRAGITRCAGKLRTSGGVTTIKLQRSALKQTLYNIVQMPQPCATIDNVSQVREIPPPTIKDADSTACIMPWLADFTMLPTPSGAKRVRGMDKKGGDSDKNTALVMVKSQMAPLVPSARRTPSFTNATRPRRGVCLLTT